MFFERKGRGRGAISVQFNLTQSGPGAKNFFYFVDIYIISFGIEKTSLLSYMSNGSNAQRHQVGLRVRKPKKERGKKKIKNVK